MKVVRSVQRMVVLTQQRPHKPQRRGYSSDFPTTYNGGRYLLDKMPLQLWLNFKAKCKRKGVSVRATLLTFMTNWLAEGD